jgi:hypothetical protein
VSCFDADRAAIWLRRRYLGYLPVHGEDVAGVCRAKPFEAASQADESTRQRNTTVHQETHGDGRRVPAAGDEPFEERCFCGSNCAAKALICASSSVCEPVTNCRPTGKIIEVEGVPHAAFPENGLNVP